MNTRVVSLLLFISGLCALLFQMAWLREFRLIFGASTPASAAVVAIFMGGLGVGNLVLGKRADTVANPLRLYGQLELAISILGGLSPLLVQFVRATYLAMGGQETLGVIGATVVRLALSAIVIGPATFVMGGTLSAAARAVTRADDDSRGNAGRLYGLNTLGAVAGTLLGTFVLLEWIGNRQTLWLAATLNLANSTAAWWQSARWQGPAESTNAPAQEFLASPAATRQKKGKKQRDDVPSTASVKDSQAHEPTASHVMVYAAAAIVGLVFFLMEL